MCYILPTDIIISLLATNNSKQIATNKRRSNDGVCLTEIECIKNEHSREKPLERVLKA